MVRIAQGLRARGYECVALIGSTEGETARALRADGTRFVALDQALISSSRVAQRIGTVPYLGYLRYVIDALALLRRAVRMAVVLRRERIDIAHAHVINSIIVARIAGAIARVPVRVSHVTGPYHLEVPTFRRLDLATMRLDHCVLGGSRRVDELYEQFGVDPRHRRVVPYFADPARFDPERADGSRLRGELAIGPEVPLIGQVAYFYPVMSGPLAHPATDGRGAKGHEDFVDAAALVLRTRPDAQFVLVGDGWGTLGERHRDDIRRRCIELGIGEQVHFLGRRSDIPDVLAAVDVSVQCSLNDNYGGTLESLLMGAPTVATRVGAMPEVVRHEQTGLLVPPRDPDALASAMLRLIEDRELGCRLGAAGRELILDGFTLAHAVDGIDAVFRELLAERGLRRPHLAGVGA